MTLEGKKQRGFHLVVYRRCPQLTTSPDSWLYRALQQFLDDNSDDVKATFVVQGQSLQSPPTNGRTDSMDLDTPEQSKGANRIVLVAQDAVQGATCGHSSVVPMRSLTLSHLRKQTKCKAWLLGRPHRSMHCSRQRAQARL